MSAGGCTAHSVLAANPGPMLLKPSLLIKGAMTISKLTVN